MVEKSKFKPLIGQGSLILGQEQDSVQGGLFDANQAFSGKLTQVEIWDVELPKTTVRTCLNGALVQERDSKTDSKEDLKTVTKIVILIRNRQSIKKNTLFSVRTIYPHNEFM